MLKKFIVCTSVILFGILFASSVNAGCNGIYLGVRGGLSKPTIDDNSAGSNRFDVGGKDLMLSGALGYRYNYFRAEVEYIWRDTNEDKTRPIYDPDLDIFVGGSKSEFDYTSYMFNVYLDLLPYSWFTPFVGGGIGITKLEHTFTYPDGSDSRNKERFTWSVGGGISAKMTNKLNLDVGYRYFDFGKLGGAQIHNHEVYGGVRYVM